MVDMVFKTIRMRSLLEVSLTLSTKKS